VSSFPNALCFLLCCDDDSFSSCSIAVSVFFLSSLFHCSLLLSFLLPFVSCVWIGGGWCGWGDYSSDQYCRAVGSSVNKMASVDGPSFPPLIISVNNLLILQRLLPLLHLLPCWSTREFPLDTARCGPCCELFHILWILYCFCLMPTWSRFQYPSSYTVPVSRLVINAECCTLTIDLMHCGVRFLLCELFNYTFPLLTVHVLVRPSLRALPSIVQISSVCWGCGAYLSENLPVARCSSRKSWCACRSCARWFYRSCLVVRKAKSTRRDLIIRIMSSTFVHSGRLATLFTSCCVILKSL